MKQTRIKILSVVLVLAFAVGSFGFAPAKNQGILTDWVKTESGWIYTEASGERTTGWKKLDGTWYYFNADGVMQTGWQKIGGAWYYFHPGGAMVTGWKKLGGVWYYFASGGAMQTGWQKISGKWYHFTSGGAMQTGWQKISGSWYYLGSDGAMRSGWLKYNNKWYYLFPSGAMATGWQKIGDYWYYLKDNGEMAADEVIDGYRLDENGRWIKSVLPEDPLTRENILALLDAYDPDGAFIIRNSAEDELFSWLDDSKNIGGNLANMETAVHEQCHDFCHAPYGMRYNSVTGKYMSASENIYLGGNRYSEVPMTDVYDSMEMTAIIPEELQNTSRFDTYVAGDVYMASRQEGIYGLFNEFTAYCWGMNNMNRMDQYRKDNSIRTGYVYNTYVAYAEFRYYILTYLIYAQTNYPAVYQAIIDNETFCSAFVSVENTFKREAEAYRTEHSTSWTSFDTEYNQLMTAMNESAYTSAMQTIRSHTP